MKRSEISARKILEENQLGMRKSENKGTDKKKEAISKLIAIRPNHERDYRDSSEGSQIQGRYFLKYESHGTVLDNMKQEVRRLLKATREHSDLLKLIDSLQHLGVAYHFQEEIEAALNLVQFNTSFDLYTTALQFRLLRENGHPISSDVFNKFKDIEGGFMKSLSQDVTGLLSLYEASYYGMDSENDLEEAKNLSVKHLSSLIGKMNIKGAEQVRRSLEIPLRWRMPRLEARNFIDLYPKDNGVGSSLLLELSKLDYNLVQSVHQREVKELMK
ncbi:hypothetical protein U1Q18_001372 [Sarracenia purpurea var. burkii]